VRSGATQCRSVLNITHVPAVYRFEMPTAVSEAHVIIIMGSPCIFLCSNDE